MEDLSPNALDALCSGCHPRLHGFYALISPDRSINLTGPSSQVGSAVRTGAAAADATSTKTLSRFWRENCVPVGLHADNGPAFGFCFVPGFIEMADVRSAIVSPLALGIVVMHDETEART